MSEVEVALKEIERMKSNLSSIQHVLEDAAKAEQVKDENKTYVPQTPAVIIYPYEVFTINQLAERLGVSYNTIKLFMERGLEYKKVNSLTWISAQAALNFFNQATEQYDSKIVTKVFNKTGVQLEKKRRSM